MFECSVLYRTDVRQFVVITSAGVLAAPFTASAQENQEEGTLDTVIVTGTRDAKRTQFDTLTPIDVISSDAVSSSVSNELGDALAQLVPSFNVQQQPSANGQQFVRPARLRGLSPDQTLVLINGKRFHRSSLISVRGAQAPDLAQIPSLAIKHIEVLRDGASAQYGSDAIAGVINIILDDSQSLEGFSQYSQFYAGDGADTQLGLRGGFAIGDGGSVVATAEYADTEETSRTRQRPDAIAFQNAHPDLNVPNPVQRWGLPETRWYRFGLNSTLPLDREHRSIRVRHVCRPPWRQRLQLAQPGHHRVGLQSVQRCSLASTCAIFIPRVSHRVSDRTRRTIN